MEDRPEYVVGRIVDLGGRQGEPLTRRQGYPAGTRFTLVAPTERVVDPDQPPAAVMREAGTIPVLCPLFPGRFTVHTYPVAMVIAFESPEALRHAQQIGLVRLELCR